VSILAVSVYEVHRTFSQKEKGLGSEVTSKTLLTLTEFQAMNNVQGMSLHNK